MDREGEGTEIDREETGAPFTFELRLFGAAEARLNGRPLPRLRARAGLSLLALLALRPRYTSERVWLAATLWPDSSDEQALYNLRRNLVDVRRVLGEQAGRLESPTPRTLRLDLTDAFCDVHVFDAALHHNQTASTKQMEAAVALYRGPLLEGCMDEWVFAEREARQQDWLAAIEALAARAIRDGGLAEAVRRLGQVVAADPYRETAQRTLMETLAAVKDPAAAMFAYRKFRHLLLRELRSEPSLETQALYNELRCRARARGTDAAHTRTPDLSDSTADLEVGNRVSRTGASPPGDTAATRLPYPLDLLIGRIEERQEVHAALQTARLVTLTGTGGVGKTRLALSVAEEADIDFPDGIWFADLSPIQDGKAAAQAVVAALGLRQDTDVTPEETLCGFVRQKRLLLILDNGEQIADACARLAIYLLRACPLLRILCTSRQPLYVPGENVRVISPLRIPPAPTATDNAEVFAADLTNYEAVALLLDRAMRASPAFRLTPRNAPAIAQLCRQLDGLPLALELVAARFRSLSALEITSRLGRRMRLSGPPNPTQPRHQTLQAALDWSYDLLDEAERRLLRRLTVFAGGWTLEAAEAVSSDLGSPENFPFRIETPTRTPKPKTQNWEVLDLLTSLVDKSLVVYEEQEEQGRYRLLETTREYAAERLSPEERQSIQKRHADYFVFMAHSMAESNTDFEVHNWLERLWIERDNFRAAHTWYQEEDAETALWLEFLLYGTRTWPVQNARDWIARLQQQPMLPTMLGARISYSVGSWALWLGDPASERLLQQALQVACACGNNLWQMRVLASLTALEEERGNKRQAFEYAEATLVCAKRSEDIAHIAEFSAEAALHLWRLGEAATAHARLQALLQEGRYNADWRLLYHSLWALGEMAFEHKEYAAAQVYYDEALPLAERHLPLLLANLWRKQAQATSLQQDYAAAWRCLENALAISRQMRTADREGWTRWDMAEVAFRQGDVLQAQTQLAACLSVFEAIHEPRSVAQCLYKLAKFCTEWGQTVRAVTLLAGAERAFQEQEFTISLEMQDAVKSLAGTLRFALDSTTWQTAWQHGNGMTLAQATAYASSTLAPPPSSE